MLIFIPMAGFGDRYIKAGYVEPKPLIPVDGVPMIERVIAGFRQGVPDAKFLFCINRKHAELPAVREALERAAPGSPVVVIDPHKDGPVRTLLDCEAHISDGEDVVLNYCDFGADWSTGTLFIKGGLVANLNYLDTAFNMGNFSFVDYKSGAWHKDHEAGHTLNLAAFGSVFHLIGAVDENVFRGANAYSERIAESNSSSGGSMIAMWA